MSAPNEVGLVYTVPRRVGMPAPITEDFIGVSMKDWDRICRRLDSPIDIPKLEVGYSVLFGVAATAFIGFIPTIYAQGLPAWVAPAFGLLSFFSLILACVLVWLDRKLLKSRRSRMQEIKDEMDGIKANSIFQNPRTAPATESFHPSEKA